MTLQNSIFHFKIQPGDLVAADYADDPQVFIIP